VVEDWKIDFSTITFGGYLVQSHTLEYIFNFFLLTYFRVYILKGVLDNNGINVFRFYGGVTAS
jgi:hypothetical protein